MLIIHVTGNRNTINFLGERFKRGFSSAGHHNCSPVFGQTACSGNAEIMLSRGADHNRRFSV
jgi:hypothetical protein